MGRSVMTWALARSARAFLGLSERNLGVKQAALVSSTTSTTTTRDASFVSFLIKKSFFPTFAAKDGGEGKEENNATKSVLSKALDFAAPIKMRDLNFRKSMEMERERERERERRGVNHESSSSPFDSS